MSSTMARVSFELFECPVCFEIPDGAIYQCRNGHSICETCSRGVVLCPQCRDPLGRGKGKNKIRNRSMEAFIAGMEVDCQFEKQGCKVKVPRKLLKAHVENSCDFSPARSTNLCKILGFTSCHFRSSRGQQDHVLRHLMEEHHVEVSHRRLSSSASQEESVIETAILSRSLEYMKNSEENRMTHGGLDVEIQGESRFKLLICYYTNIKQGNNYSVICLNLGEEFPGAGITVEISAPAKKARWIWSGKPIHFMKAEQALINPPFQIPIPYLLEVLGEDDKELNLAISYF